MNETLVKINEVIKYNLKITSKNYSSLSEFGFEQFLSSVYHQIQLGKKYYVISFSVDEIFSNIRKRKLSQKLYNIGLSDDLISQLLVKYNGEISDEIIELFLTEFDTWCDSQWVTCDYVNNFNVSRYYKNGNPDKSNAFRSLRRHTKLKEFYEYRYKTNIIILANSSDIINRVKFAVIDWFEHRFSITLNIKYVDLRKSFTKCCDYNIRVVDKNGKYIIKSCVPEDKIAYFTKELRILARKFIRNNNPNKYSIYLEKYNRLVFSIHSYYKFATNVSIDLNKLSMMMNNLVNREIRKTSSNISKNATNKTEVPDLYKQYLKSDAVRYLRSTGQVILPVGYIKFHKPMFRNK